MRAPRRHVMALDSGVGGLGIVAALRQAVPGVAITYLADNGFYPYGIRSDGELVEHLLGLVGRAVNAYAPELVVVACNTASTIALDALRRHVALPFVGTVPPVKWAAALSRTRTIGLLATEATVGRTYVRDLQERFAPDCRLLAYGARDLADLAETRFVGRAVPRAAIEREVTRLFDRQGGDAIDVVCLGCTHYGLLLAELRAAGPDDMIWLDPAEAVARRTADMLRHLPATPSATVTDRVLTTAVPAEPDAFARAALHYGFEQVELLAARERQLL